MPGDRRMWARLAVGLSIGLNLFLIGFLGARAWPFADHAAVPPATVSGERAAAAPLREALRQLVGSLSPADGRLLREAFAARLPELIALHRQTQAAAERVRLDIGRPSLDLEALRADLAATHEARRKIAPVVDEVLLDVLPRLSEQGRKTLSQYRLRARQ
jgi:uncharacterized membrane protein